MSGTRTFSFASVSCLSAAARVSLVSPCRTGAGPGFKEALRVTAVCDEAETRDVTAERAVAPLAIDGDGAWPGGGFGDDRRAVAEGGREDAVVAMKERLGEEGGCRVESYGYKKAEK